MYAISRTTVKGKKVAGVVEFVPSLKADGSPQLSVDRGTKLPWVVGTVPGSKRNWFCQPQYVFASQEEATSALPKAEEFYANFDAGRFNAKAEPVQEVAQETPAQEAAPSA